MRCDCGSDALSHCLLNLASSSSRDSCSSSRVNSSAGIQHVTRSVLGYNVAHIEWANLQDFQDSADGFCAGNITNQSNKLLNGNYYDY